MRSKLALPAITVASLLGDSGRFGANSTGPRRIRPGRSRSRRHGAQNEIRQDDENQQDEIRHYHRDEFQRPQEP